jgi:iron complex outermembrane recepter protein
VLPTCTGPVTIPRGATAPTTFIDLSCAPFPFTPRNQFAINARYAHELGDAGTLVLSGNYSHADRNWTAVATLPSKHPDGYIDSYDVFNASIDWNGLFGSGLDARLFVTNLTNQTYRISNRATSLDTSSGFSTAIYNEPRMYGVQVRYRFGER